jgi:hypothetical protein
VECCELGATTVTFEVLVVIREETTKEVPDSKRSTKSFEPIEGIKEVLIDPSSPEGKVVCISTSLSPK